MPKKSQQKPKPTGAELSLLRVLWDRGPSTVREVHEAIGGKTGYTTTLKILQKMAAKGLVLRDQSQRTHIYKSATPAEKTQRDLVGDLVQKAFGGRPGKLVVQALSNQRATPEELTEIRELLDSIEARNHRDAKSKRKGRSK